MKLSFSPALNFPWSGSTTRLLITDKPIRNNHLTSSYRHRQAVRTLWKWVSKSWRCRSDGPEGQEKEACT